MTDHIVNIEIDTLEGGVNIAIDRAQTSVAFLAFGIISGALKAFYADHACETIAKYLAVAAGLRDDAVEINSADYKYLIVANKVLAGVRQLFDGFDNYDFEVALCCRYIYDDLQIPSSSATYHFFDELKITKVEHK